MNLAYDKFLKLAIKAKSRNRDDFLQLKKKISKKLKLPLPSNADLRERYEKLVKDKKIKRNGFFEKILATKSIRTQSGVAVVAVLTKSYPCPGKCLYCPTEPDMPKSYLSNEPAVMRAIDARFNPYSQVQNRLRSLALNGHKTDKIELIVMGGTFSCLPKNYQKWFITECFRACNDYPRPHRYASSRLGAKRLWQTCNKKSLFLEQKRNEKAKHRIIGLTLETRPDYIDEKEIINFRQLGCTRVELGVQSIFNSVLKINKRGHDVKKTIEATKLLKDAGFKINYHIMPGLPGSNVKKDYEMFKTLFSDSRFQPDMLKIYPTVVIKDSGLYKIWKGGKYKALNDKKFEKLIVKIKNEVIPPYVRISRLIRDVPATSIVSGPIVSNLRQIISSRSKCPCIRCREVRAEYKTAEKIILNRINYDASEGKEIFLEYTSPDRKKLFAILRLRITDNAKHFIPALRNAALIREVHTYGKMTEVDKKDKLSPQHIGLGKKLIAEAEKIAAREFHMKKIVVISGVGVRDYYKKIGYRLKDTYMAKSI
ncbi:MAG TPA: tRNA uridine(34) 5-carboxymethylaminomethyl modification radical SAM/GNAT enzyme Elp3 [Candidatus Moranbacteria bacterium]|nr:tRNA uridine(34) 5-carboxymethylaminomethyl modification radical SAM/GNAT enzyme Elp3 [Candidatus Moranbacteria bacterium]